jgi:uncharacterized protein
MLVVSNTSPLLNLAIIGHLNLIKEQFNQVIIPVAVFKELRLRESLPGSNLLEKAYQDKWLKVQSVTNNNFVKLLQRELDQGESEAIALAIELKADLILLDEKEGRRIARTFDLPITGVLGILLKGKNEGTILSLNELINQLNIKANFRIAPHL